MLKLKSWKTKFGIIWLGQAFSLLGSSAAQFALVWWIATTTGSANTLSMAGLTAYLPIALLGPFAGVWVDRLSRRLVMAVSDLFVAACALWLLLAFRGGEPPIGLILAILCLRAVGGVFHMPAMQATMPLLLPADMITRGQGWSQMIQSASTTLGPVVGAALMAGGASGLRLALLLDVIGAVIASASVAILDIPNPEKTKREQPHILREMKEGAKTLYANKPLFAITWPTLVSMTVYIPLSTLYPLIVSAYFGGTPWHSSAAEVAFGLGMIISGAMVGIFGSKNKFNMIAMSLLVMGLALVGCGLLPPGGIWPFIFFTGVTGITVSFMSAPYFGYMQESTDPAVLGRVSSLIYAGMSLAAPIGLFIAGPAAEAAGIANWFAISGGLIALTGFASLALAKRYPPAA